MLNYLLKVTLYSLNRTLKMTKLEIWWYNECHLEFAFGQVVFEDSEEENTMSKWVSLISIFMLVICTKSQY